MWLTLLLFLLEPYGFCKCYFLTHTFVSLVSAKETNWLLESCISIGLNWTSQEAVAYLNMGFLCTKRKMRLPYQIPFRMVSIIMNFSLHGNKNCLIFYSCVHAPCSVCCKFHRIKYYFLQVEVRFIASQFPFCAQPIGV